MVAFFMSVGIAGALVSLFALGFGFAYNSFDLGNTLIIAGTVGLGASLALVGIAAVLRELRRVADVMTARVPERGLPASEPADTAPGRARIPYPPKPEPAVRERASDVRMTEPQIGMEAERPRNIFAAARAEPPLVAEPEPLAQTRPTMAPPPAEPPYEPKFGPADILARIGGGRAAKSEAPREVRAPAEEVSPPEPPLSGERTEPEPTRRGRGMFDGVWPAESPARSGEAEAPARPPRPEHRPEPRPESRPELRHEPRSEPRSEPRPETRYELRRPRAEPPPLQSAVTPPPAAASTSAPAEPRPNVEARPASILKSGVIDGMAYTLYTDGSIEAQLPQGTVHFASIEELRLHLEKNG
ncbi:hypothetical protein RA307_25475 [Xanthobacteraceae bacterium Astr-EGSB]|uniref:hypothetical protein n=1 Tax=Astrobacterium formosum TaxID=3069710 RepID=UPI0027B139F4|nr:hypothetical protein [Xanthobacteraceae bacterium Astr-EGSB]